MKKIFYVLVAILGIVFATAGVTTNAKAATNDFTITSKTTVNITLKVKTADYGAFNTPSPLPGAKKLLDGSVLNGKYITAIADDGVSNGEHYYNFKYGDRYYWINTRATQQVFNIISKRSVNLNLKVVTPDYGAFNTPSPIEGANKLLDGSVLNGKTITAIADYGVSNGEHYYNFKYGNRYYWINTRATSFYITGQTKYSGGAVKVATADYGAFNTPSPITGAVKLVDGAQLNNKTITPVAVDTVSNGEKYYNFKYGSRYYWINTRATATINNKQQAVVNLARQQLGKPYVWGATGPSSFDCSGLTQYVFSHAAGINLPRVTTQQEHSGVEVSLNALLPGDLLFWGNRNNTYHVAIYIGDGDFIQAPQPGDVVKITNMRYYYPNFARRVL